MIPRAHRCSRKTDEESERWSVRRAMKGRKSRAQIFDPRVRHTIQRLSLEGRMNYYGYDGRSPGFSSAEIFDGSIVSGPSRVSPVGRFMWSYSCGAALELNEIPFSPQAKPFNFSRGTMIRETMNLGGKDTTKLGEEARTKMSTTCYHLIE